MFDNSFSSISCRWITKLAMFRTDLLRAICVLIAISGYCSAEPATTPYLGGANTLPEVIIVPIKAEGKVLAEGGWILTFRFDAVLTNHIHR